MAEPLTLEVPLFPLDSVVLFPGTVQTFHIFEERYRRLVSDTLEADGLLAIPLFKPGWEEHYFEAPAVHRTAGLGQIVEHELLDGGCRNIAVEGRARVHLLREIRQKPYRVAVAQVIEDTLRPEDRPAVAAELAKIRRLCQKVAELFPHFHRDLASLDFAPALAARTADLVAHVFVRDVYDRQSILNEADVHRRLQLTRVQLMLLLQRFLRSGPYQEFMASLDRL